MYRKTLVALVIVLAGCGGQQPAQQVEVTRVVEVTREVPITVEVLITATPEPVAEGEPTESPAAQQASGTWTATQIVEAFKAAGLEAENPTAIKREDRGLAPLVCVATRFLIPSLGEDKGGRIFECDKDKEKAALRAYYEALSKGSAAFYSHVMERDNILIQINGELSDEQAAKYQVALDGLRP
jgi:hypothetical protein